MLDQINIRYWKILRASYFQLLEKMDEWRKDGKHHYVCFCDGNGLPLAWYRDVELRAAYAGADAVCADGIATDWLARINGGAGGRIIGPKLFPAALKYGIPLGWRHFFYGASGTTLAALKTKMEVRFPGVKIVGTFAPEIADDPMPPPIEKNSVDFLWVALGCPKQEKWCARHRDELGVPVLLPVGAAFDFLSGRVADTPDWVHRMGLCWLWRLVTGGRRVFVRNVKCVTVALALLIEEFWRVKVLGITYLDNKGKMA